MSSSKNFSITGFIKRRVRINVINIKVVILQIYSLIDPGRIRRFNIILNFFYKNFILLLTDLLSNSLNSLAKNHLINFFVSI